MTQRQFVDDLFASYELHLSFAFRPVRFLVTATFIQYGELYMCARCNIQWQNLGLRTIRTIMGLASYCVTSRKEGRTHV